MLKKETSLRLFFALWPSEAERQALSDWQPVLRRLCGGRTMRVDGLHATLVFLGNVAEHRLEALKLAAQETTFHGFALTLDTARYWGHNHIVYAAPEAVPQPLADLVASLEQGLRRHHFHFDERAYKPHVTLLRHAKWNDEPLPSMPAVRWQVTRFALVQSLSDDSGARYRALAYFRGAELE